MHRVRAFLTLCLALWALPCRAEIPRPTLYLPLDGHTAAALAGGSPYPQVAGEEDTILTLVGARKSRFSPGVVGQACDIGDSPLVFGAAGNFRPDEGTCAFWLAPRFRGDNRDLYAAFFGAADWGMLYKYQNQAYFTFGTAKEQRDLYYGRRSRPGSRTSGTTSPSPGRGR